MGADRPEQDDGPGNRFCQKIRPMVAKLAQDDVVAAFDTYCVVAVHFSPDYFVRIVLLPGQLYQRGHSVQICWNGQFWKTAECGSHNRSVSARVPRQIRPIIAYSMGDSGRIRRRDAV